jgi:hypothetical protein
VIRLSAAVLAAAAAAAGAFVAIEVSVAANPAVRAEVTIAREGYPLDVRRIRIVDGLLPGRTYRLPAVGIRNRRGRATTYRLVVLGTAHRWLRVVPAQLAIAAGRSGAVGLRLQLPDAAESGVYEVTIRVRPGGSEGARLTFRVEPAGTAGWTRRPAGLAIWIAAAVAGAILLGVRMHLGA